MKPGAVPMILCLHAMPLERIGESAGSVATMRRRRDPIAKVGRQPGDGPAGAGGADQHVEIGAEVVEDLVGGAPVRLRIRGVVVLAHEEVALLLLQPPRLLDRANRTLVGGGEDDLGTVGDEDALALLAHVLGHDEHRPVSLHRRDHRESDTGVARGRLDDGHVRGENAATLRVLDHVERGAVLDRPAGVEALELHPECGGKRVVDLVEADHRSPADGRQDIVVAHVHSRGFGGAGRQADTDPGRCHSIVSRSPPPPRSPPSFAGRPAPRPRPGSMPGDARRNSVPVPD